MHELMVDQAYQLNVNLYATLWKLRQCLPDLASYSMIHQELPQFKLELKFGI
jgi:hypothetical protein